MFVETVKSEGLAHLSYVIGSNGEAAVIDPRRDCSVYIEKAAARDCRITRIFETHRNEDLVSGAPILSAQTGATVMHGPNAAGDVAYAETATDGDEFDIGRIRVRVLETPGHTDDSLSYALFDLDEPEKAVAVFTGDALFVGDVISIPSVQRRSPGCCSTACEKSRRSGRRRSSIRRTVRALSVAPAWRTGISRRSGTRWRITRV